MMEGINAAGKRVSLLNDTPSLPYHPKETKSASLPRPSLARDSPAHRPSHSSRTTTASSFLSHTITTAPSTTTITTTTTTAAATTSSTTNSNSSNYHSDSDSFISRSSRHSSVTSPLYSPSARAVPSLLRHDSTSSSQSMNTPSPMTPTYPFAVEPLDPKDKAVIGLDTCYNFASHVNGAAASLLSPSTQPFFTAPNSLSGSTQPAMYAGFPAMQQAQAAPQPPIFDDSAYPLAAVPQMQFQYATDLIQPVAVPALSAPLSSPNAATSDAASANGNSSAPGSASKPAKKKYPCPHAARFGCTDTFTTSGHAARHGKKHTGEKNILCPTCNKAFTRKDNMKQHERTHKNRNSDSVDHGKPSGASSGHSRRTQSISSVANSTLTHKSSGSTEMDLDSSPGVDGVDSKRSSLQRPPLDRPVQYVGYMAGTDGRLELPSRPELNRQFSGESQDGEGESPGLDALAMAASELR